MRRNRRKHVSGGLVPPWTIGLLALIALTIGTYAVLENRYTRLGDEYRRGEFRLQTLNNGLCRETARWKENLQDAALDAALRAQGLRMRRPNVNQIVRMRAGRPVPNQRSLAYLSRNNDSPSSVARK